MLKNEIIKKQHLILNYILYFPKYLGITNRKEAEIISDRFNELYDEKERLKKENKLLFKVSISSKNKYHLLNKIRGRTILSKNIGMVGF